MEVIFRDASTSLPHILRKTMTHTYRDDSVPGYIYLIEAKDFHGIFPGCYLKRCKIGLTRDIERRLSDFASNQPPCDIQLLKSIYVEDMDEVESQLHQQYKSANVKLLKSREWFDLYPWQVEVIKAQMSRLAAKSEPQINLKYLVATALIIAGVSMGSASYLRSAMSQPPKIEVSK